MPLPANETPWPPRDDEQARGRLAEHDAWYSGDTDRIDKVYGRDAERPSSRPSQYAGGLKGRLARFWYGKPDPFGRQPSRLHAGLPGDLAQAAAELLFSESPTLRPEDEKNLAARDELESLVRRSQLVARLSEAAEVGAALGGTFLRGWWDREVAGHPLVQVVHPDNAWPTIIGGRLRSVMFVQVIDDDGSTVLRHVEQHEPDGWILHALYQGTHDRIGFRRNLADHKATAGLPDQVPPVLPGELSVAYVPNMLPNPVSRGSWLGRSDYVRNEQLFDWLDETITSWRRDVRLAKGRLIVPDGYLTSLGPGRGAMFDVEREVYEQINIPPMSGQNASPITVAQFAIRVAEHRDTARQIMQLAVSNAGYSTSTFGLGDEAAAGGAKTATEIRERKARSLTRRDRQIGYWTPALEHITRVLAAIDAQQFGGRLAGLPVRVDWPDGVAVDLLTLAQTAVSLRTAEAASDETIIRTVHPDWGDEQVTAEVAAIGKARAEANPPDPLDVVPV